MPWQTQMQQAYGTGGAGASPTLAQQSGAAPAGLPRWTPGSSAAAVQAGFNAMFGGMTPGRVKEMRDSGTLTSGANQEVGQNTRNVGAGMGPAAASQANSMMPGFFNGNDQPGIPKSVSGFPQGGGMRPMMVPPSPGPAPLGGASPLETAVAPLGMDEAKAKAGKNTTPQAAPSDPGVVSAPPTPTTPTPTTPAAPPAPPAPTTPVQAATGTVYNPSDPTTWWKADGSYNWTGTDIANDTRGSERWLTDPTKLAGWATMTPEQRAAAKNTAYNPYSTVTEYFKQAPDAAALAAYQKLFAGDPAYIRNLPEFAQSGVGTLGQNLGTKTLSEAEIAAMGYDPAVLALMQQYGNFGEQLASGQDLTPENLARQSEQYATLGAILNNVYGITWDPLTGYKNAVPAPNPDDTNGSIPDNTTIATDLPNLSLKVPDLLQAIGGKMENAPLLEFAMQQWLQQQGLQQQQKGIYLLDDAVKQSLAENNPLRRESERLALEALQNPDPVNYEQVKNRLASDYAKGRESGNAALAQSLAGRGLSASTGIGLGAQMNSQSQMDLARALSELDMRQAENLRTAQYGATTNAANVDRAYAGAESTLRQMLANAVMGAPNVAQNPYAGMADTRTALEALKMQQGKLEDAAEAEKGSALSQGLGALGTVVGAYFGGPMGAAAGNAAGTAAGKALA